MKQLNILLLMQFAVHFVNCTKNVVLINWKDYVEKVSQDFVYEIEDYGFCNFFLKDYQYKINRNFFETNVSGVVYLRNGFLGPIQDISIYNTMQAQIDEDESKAYITFTLYFNQLTANFDYRAELSDGNLSGTLQMFIPNIVTDIQIDYSYKTKNVDGQVQVKSIQNPTYKNWYFQPNNKYTEIIHRDIKIDWSVSDDINGLSKTIMKKLLHNVIKRYDFPKTCYSCKEKY